MIKTMFNNVMIGQKFAFYFDVFDNDMCYSWCYRKVGNQQIKCIYAPRTEKQSLNKIERISDFVKDSECYIIED